MGEIGRDLKRNCTLQRSIEVRYLMATTVTANDGSGGEAAVSKVARRKTSGTQCVVNRASETRKENAFHSY
jgi:hypothetical protein